MTGTQTFRMWKKLVAILVIGKRLFSLAAVLTASHPHIICPELETMEPGLAIAHVSAWWGVRNHIKSVHAIAACNLAEFATGILCEVSVPTTHRWVSKGMTTSYKHVSADGLTATVKVELPDFSIITPETGGVDFPTHVVLTGAGDTKVQDITINCWVTAKKPRQPPHDDRLL